MYITTWVSVPQVMAKNKMNSYVFRSIRPLIPKQSFIYYNIKRDRLQQPEKVATESESVCG